MSKSETADKRRVPQLLPLREKAIRWADCPDCGGRGTFLRNPFAIGGHNGCGGMANIAQCGRCMTTYEYYQQHGKLPQ